MPDLPTFTVTPQQAQRISAAFGTDENYKEWLKNQIMQYVFSVERAQMAEQFEADVRARSQDVSNDLNF